ncbi:hypothetical protein BSKO_09915 [Bryopsis sp. KO-2023]|nr:hypothetical protein BSKO_09915 [Bryopsis sp. KO-2023]
MSGRRWVVAVAVLSMCSSVEIGAAAGFNLGNFLENYHASTREAANIVGGVPAQRNEFPFVASIRYPEGISTRRTDLSGHHFCGGSLIAKNVVLTAAHCVKDPWLNRFRAKPVVHVGRLTREGFDGGNFETFHTRETRIHPKYKERNRFDYDIALIVLDRDSIQAPIGFHTDERCFEPWSGCDRGTVVGWGLTNHSERRSFAEQLLKVEVPLVPRDQCRKAFSFLNDSMVCAGEVGRDSCKHDSGGPLLVERKVAGVVSFGFGCGTGLPAIYGNVGGVNDWIQEQLKEIDAEIPSTFGSSPIHSDVNLRSPRLVLPLSSSHTKEQ